MKVQGWLFSAVGVFFAVVDVIYWFWSREPVGTTAMAIAVGLALMIGYYLLFTARRIGEQPEDNKEAEVSDGAGEIGFFSPYSWWPLFITLAAALTAAARPRLRRRLVAVHHRHRRRAHGRHRVRLRVLPRQLLALAHHLSHRQPSTIAGTKASSRIHRSPAMVFLQVGSPL